MQENKRLKVCFVITKGLWGGAQRYVYDLATRLQSPEASSNGGQANLPKDRFEAIMICGQGEILPQKLEAVGIRTIRLPKLKKDFSFFSAVTIGLKTLWILVKERPDVVHLNSAKASGVGAVAGRLAGIRKIIYTVHGFAFNEDRSFLSKTIIWFFSWITILLSHKTIVIAEKEKRQALKMPFVKNKIVLIHNGIEKIEFKEKKVAQSELFSRVVKTGIDNILCIGTISELTKNKGLEYAISAVSKIKTSFVFFIVGEGEERNNLEKLIKQNSLKNKVFLVGFLENANQYLKAFDIFTLTSIKEGLPYTILEAGLAGLPVVASNIGGIPDIIDSTSGILVTKTRPGEITRAIEYLISNPDKRQLYSKNLNEKVEKEFSLEQMLKKTLEVYK